MSSVALTVLRHGGCCTASISKVIRAAYDIHISPSLFGGLTTTGWLNAAQKNGIPVCLQGFLRIACCQSLQLPPAPSELNKTRRAQQLPWDPSVSEQLNETKYTVPILELSGLEL